MSTIKNQIIPLKPTFIGNKTELDRKAICIFAAIGFFLDNDTYYKDLKALRPATNYILNNNVVLSEEKYFKWHYTPVERPLHQIVQEFAVLFETIIKEQTENKKVILPLSGGLDSRTQAAALHYLGKSVHAYGYAFQGGHDETRYGEKIAKVCGFPFEDWKVQKGYLWSEIEKLAQINGCYSDFTHPRQMAFVNDYSSLGGIFSLGHWGDVLFDDMGVSDSLSLKEQTKIIVKKIVKKGGLELAEELWQSWQLDGDFKEYLFERIQKLLLEINIPTNANAQIRAFKSLYWAPRWTSTNLSVFESVRSISVPYYDNRMCEFICSVPEKYLARRQIQIEYLKMRNPELAKITWQSQKPFNLYNYHLNKVPYNLPYRIFDKVKRTLKPQKYIQRNWELQFLGEENEKQLKKWLFENEKMNAVLPKELSLDFYDKFKNEDSVYYSHAVSMLLTLSLFFKK
ncbi:MAG: asparagine synthetase B family protein [Bacteroidota bacterium]